MNQLLLNQHAFSPSKVVCIGRNYIEHIEELNNAVPDEPVIFIKPNSAISNEIILTGQDEVHYETELAFLIKDNKIKAVGIGFDLTKRSIQTQLKTKGLPWELAKAFDGSAVFSAFIPIDNINNLTLELSIDNSPKQFADINKMIYTPIKLINFIQQSISLEDNDIILTGTPKGVGVVKSGAHFNAQLKQNGQLLLEHTREVQEETNK